MSALVRLRTGWKTWVMRFLAIVTLASLATAPSLPLACAAPMDSYSDVIHRLRQDFSEVMGSDKRDSGS